MVGNRARPKKADGELRPRNAIDDSSDLRDPNSGKTLLIPRETAFEIRRPALLYGGGKSSPDIDGHHPMGRHLRLLRL